MNVSNLNPIKKGKYFFTFLPTGNNLFKELTMFVCITFLIISLILANLFLKYLSWDF